MQSETLLSEQIFGAISEGILVYDGQGEVTHLNPAFQNFFADYGVSCFIGMKRKDLIKSAIFAGVPELPNCETGSPEANFTHPSGRHILLRNHVLPAGGEAITMTDVTGVSYVKDLYNNVQPISAPANDDAGLQDARPNDQNANFLANMSHEIRTPLNGVLGMAQLLKTKNLGQLEASFVDTIETSGQALLKIVEDIFDYAKLETNQMELTPISFDTRAVAESVLQMFRAPADAKNIGLHLRLAPDLPARMIGDENRIRQILSNLVSNAVKFTNSGQILIDLNGAPTDEDYSFNIKVTDTGVGIPADELENIFTEFCNSVSTTNYRQQGTGLGLCVSNNLARMMGGNISVISEPGKGSIFTFDVPLPVDTESTARLSNPDGIKNLNVLIIDNHPTNREMLKEQISLGGAKVIGAATALKGIKILKNANEKGIRIDAVVIDYHLPSMTGAECVDQIRVNSAFAAIPIVMITSIDDPNLRKHMRHQGVNSCLLKPVSAKDIRAAIATEMMPKHQTIAAQPAQSHIDVLIAEDNDVNQYYIEHVMKKIGLSYKIVPNGKIAIEEWNRLSPRIILMDISMPEVNGVEATQAIRELEQMGGHGRTPIIAVTAHARDSDERMVRAEGMDDYLSKPLSIMRLQRKLSDWGIMPVDDPISASA